MTRLRSHGIFFRGDLASKRLELLPWVLSLSKRETFNSSYAALFLGRTRFSAEKALLVALFPARTVLSFLESAVLSTRDTISCSVGAPRRLAPLNPIGILKLFYDQNFYTVRSISLSLSLFRRKRGLVSITFWISQVMMGIMMACFAFFWLPVLDVACLCHVFMGHLGLSSHRLNLFSVRIRGSHPTICAQEPHACHTNTLMSLVFL